MKKISYILTGILPAVLLFSSVDAQAQRRNTTSHDVKPAYQAEESKQEIVKKSDKVMQKHHKDHKDKKKCDCKKDKKCECHKKEKHHECKDKKDCNRFMPEDISENYNEAVKRINKSNFSDTQKKLLLKQAEENRDFIIKQNEARQQLMQSHKAQRLKAGISKESIKDNKSNKKALKKLYQMWED